MERALYFSTRSEYLPFEDRCRYALLEAEPKHFVENSCVEVSHTHLEVNVPVQVDLVGVIVRDVLIRVPVGIVDREISLKFLLDALQTHHTEVLEVD